MCTYVAHACGLMDSASVEIGPGQSVGCVAKGCQTGHDREGYPTAKSVQELLNWKCSTYSRALRLRLGIADGCRAGIRNENNRVFGHANTEIYQKVSGGKVRSKFESTHPYVLKQIHTTRDENSAVQVGCQGR